ncbi:MAG: bifunctional riboflavin kinase/FAD synthetase [Dehalococcoidia bacterium]|nr:MAG: bifunctional riboflavin kinase/FAD synthetase [Dehalococcoidia bacterium]
MQLIAELASFSPERETLLTVGVFDGIHLGHQHLIRRLTQQAATMNLLGGVVTFNSHPQNVLSPQTKLARLTTIEERTRLLRGLGVELVVPLDFSTEVAALSAREFVSLLQVHLRMRGLIVGPDFALGRGREGDVAALQTLGQELGFTVEVVEPLISSGSLVSSTAIRKALSRGDMRATSKFLGRYFRLSGPVIGGMERGHVLGFPTANIAVDSDQALPIDGVYATLGHIGDKVYKSVTNIGIRPTFGEGERTIEVFLIDFAGDIYGEKLAVELIERLRGEMKFADAGELSAQISRDVEQARSILK